MLYEQVRNMWNIHATGPVEEAKIGEKDKMADVKSKIDNLHPNDLKGYNPSDDFMHKIHGIIRLGLQTCQNACLKNEVMLGQKC